MYSYIKCIKGGLKYFCIGLFVIFILFFLIVIIHNKGIDLVGIDYCCTAEIDNINTNHSEIINNDIIINENNISIINEQNTENFIDNEDNERYVNNINMEAEREQSLQSKGFLSGASTLYKKMSNRGRCRLQWHIREQFKDKYSTYKEFKENWNSNIKLRQEIKNDISLLASQAKQVNKKKDRTKDWKDTISKAYNCLFLYT